MCRALHKMCRVFGPPEGEILAPVSAANDVSRARLRRLVERLDADGLSRELPGGWTVSALLAHLAWWDRVALKRWQDVIDSGTRPTRIDDAVNDELLPEWRSIAASDAAREVLAAADAVDAIVAAAPPELVEEMRRTGGDRSVDRSLHRNEHLDEIEKAPR